MRMLPRRFHKNHVSSSCRNTCFSFFRKLLPLPLLLFALSAGQNVLAESSAIPHPVIGRVTDSKGNTPADGAVHFSAFIKGRESERLTEESVGGLYKEGFYKLNTANFSSGWKAGEHLRIEIQADSLNETAAVNMILDSRKYQKADIMLSSETEDEGGSDKKATGPADSGTGSEKEASHKEEREP